MERRWFKGDTHLHTTNSDGHLHQYELIDRCKGLGLDWIMITDHNYNTVKETYSSDGLTVIQGQELTDEPGHVNVWGKKVPFEPPHTLNTAEDYKKYIDACKKSGAVVSLNHPFCSNCPFRLEPEDYGFDCVEVWNTIQHSDNIKNMQWWHNQLLKGKHIAAVGGSDFHKSYAFIDFLAMPTTITYAKSNSAEDILEALCEGRSVITNRPNTSMIYLHVGGAGLGDTVELNGTLTGTCNITKLMPNHTVRIFNNDRIVYQYTAKGYEKSHKATFSIMEKGFVRAEITYRFDPLLEKVYAFAEKKFLSNRGVQSGDSLTLPDFFWAFTNPIWID